MADHEQNQAITQQPSRHIASAERVIDAALFAVESDDLGEAWLAGELAPQQLPPLGAEDPIAATLLDKRQYDRYVAYMQRRSAGLSDKDGTLAADSE